MINLTTGEIRVNGELTLSPWFTFEDFKNTSFYDNHDGINSIHLKEEQVIDNQSYFVSFFFRNSHLYAITLMISDISISEKDEENRKNLHDEILRLNGIENGKAYSFGKIISVYDKRSNSSEILIIYS